MRGVAVGLVIGTVLFLSGCLLGPNLPVEGPGGRWGVVLDGDDRYQLFPEGGAVWLVEADGALIGPIYEISADRDGRVLDWSPSGEDLLALIVDLGEMGAPERWRIVGIPINGSPAEVLLMTEEMLLTARYASDGSILYLVAVEDRAEVRRRSPDGSLDEVVAPNAVAFARTAETHYVLGEDGRLRDAVGEELPLHIDCRDDLCVGLLLWSDVYFSLSPTGRHVAVVLEGDMQMLAPESDADLRLFLVDLEEETAGFLAMPAIFPTFSPDGKQVAFLAEHPDGAVRIYVRDIAARATRALEGIEAATWIRWGSEGLLVGIEGPSESYEIVRWDGTEWQAFFAQPAE